MKENQKPNRRWYLWLLVIFPLLGVILLSGNSVRDRIILPVEFYLWQIVQSIKNVPQATFWIIFCGISVVFILHSLTSRTSKKVQVKEEEEQSKGGRRVTFWSNQIGMMHKGNFSRVQFAKIFSKLILDVLTYNGEIDLTTYEEELREGKLEVPYELLLYLKPHNRQLDELQSPGLLSRIKVGITGLFSPEKPKLSSENNASPGGLIEPGLFFSVNYLEKEVGIDHHQNEKR